MEKRLLTLLPASSYYSKTCTLFMLFVLAGSVFCQAQERTITGRLTDRDGSPLPGVSIVIKGTEIGTVTDFDGNYSITAPIGSTLVYSFIGMQTREVVVTESNFQSPPKKTRSYPQLPHNWVYSDTAKEINVFGVATLTSETPRYKTNSNLIPASIRSIRRLGNHYLIRMDTDPNIPKGFGLRFTTSFTLDQVNKLPALQSQYAQGQPSAGTSQWRGPDQQEIFSWGPLVRTLEYDGTSYPYDQRGKLVPSGTGNGTPAAIFNASDFFKTGVATTAELMFTKPVSQQGTFIFDFENRNRYGVIPNSNYSKTNIKARIDDFRFAQRFKLSTALTYNNSSGELLARGANLAVITGSIYRTPSTFDNTNLLSAKSALTSSTSYLLQNGTVRAAAPGLSDNPYGLVNTLPDKDEQQRWLATMNLSYSGNHQFSFNLNTTLDQQSTNSRFGTPPGYSPYLQGRLTSRQDNQLYTDGSLTAIYSKYKDYHDIKINITYEAQHTKRSLSRSDGFDFTSDESFQNPQQADSVLALEQVLSRTTQELTVQANYTYDHWLRLRFSNRNYFSNTISTKAYTNIFPSLGISVDLAELAQIYSAEEIRLHGNFSRTIREAPLLYSNWTYASATLPVNEYAAYYEGTELFHHQNLIPETEQKFETGLSVHFFGNRLNTDFIYYQSRTNDLIAPVQQTSGFALQNVADVKNEGFTISASYNRYNYYGDNWTWGTEIKWSHYTSEVTQLYSASPWIILAGFQTAQTVLAPGKPVGAIYGTSYARNNAGQLLIGNDGFPIEENTLSMIGNPIPDWILGWSAYIQHKGFKLSFLFDFKKGGDVWNGTNAMLDYLGRSTSTGDLRTTSNYVFEGVNANGNTNTIPVTFADPANPISENRWVRYGWDGIGENYIEDASWIRLSEIALSYSTQRRPNEFIQQIKCTFIARNLFLITPYSGVDPATTLFGTSAGTGLDLFNTPAVRSYSLQLTFSL